jgi:hypothetical protein
VVFWKWIAARASDNPTPLARFTGGTLDLAGREALLLDPATLRQVAVGSADLLGVELDSAEGRERAVVEVRWSAAAKDGEEPEPRAHRVVLARTAGEKGPSGLSTLDCPSCGGALADSDAVRCSYCGETLAGDARAWTLESVMAV